MIDFRLPIFLGNKLAGQDTEVRVLSSIVNDSIYIFSEWLRDSKMIFFPDYTDHGISHLEGVLSTACAIISTGSENLFTPSDAAVLILAVLFHDSALHLSEAGFYELIHGESSRDIITPFDNISWKDLWSDFLSKAKRWDNEKHSDVFGADESGDAYFKVRDPFLYWNNLSKGDLLLVGEFIRQYHARIAHEAAFFGIPGANGKFFKVAEKLSEELRDIAGLVARSHNLPLRVCIDYLYDKYRNKREYQEAHPVYLMSLLRIADYLQLKSNRSSSVTFQYKQVVSKVSKVEHEAHASIRNITDTHDDREAIEIYALPNSVKVFLRIKSWLVGIQAELDSSWAVLGEVYGADERLKKLGLKFRRVRSNLDDIEEFSKRIDYLPRQIKFDVVRANLLKLLIGPLYGEDPSFGVRELMQNSIDAVNEYEFYFKGKHNINHVRREVNHDVEITLFKPEELGYAWIVFEDRGVGMTEDVIINYFLRAGASYRTSELWKKDYQDEQNKGIIKSKVLRSGRFGVGALAAFLLGDEIKVETRHYSSDDGFTFTTNLESDTIEINRIKNMPIGTKISIRVSSIKYEQLTQNLVTQNAPAKWDWYCLDKPIVARILPDNSRPEKNKYSIKKDFSDANWRKLEYSAGYEVYWTLSKAPVLMCNGLVISNASPAAKLTTKQTNRSAKHNSIKYPNVAIIDPDALFPLTLQRSGIQLRDYPFGHELLRDYLFDMLAFLFFHGPQNPLNISTRNNITVPWFNSDGFEKAFVAGPNGFAIRLHTLLNKLPIKHLVCVHEPFLDLTILSSDVYVFFGGLSFSIKLSAKDKAFLDISVYGKSEKRSIEYISKYELSRNKKEFDYGFEKTIEENRGLWRVFSTPNCPKTGFEFKSPQLNNIKTQKGRHIEEMFFDENSVVSVSDYWVLDDLWRELFAENWIPYDPLERIQKFPVAFEFFMTHYPNRAYSKISTPINVLAT